MKENGIKKFNLNRLIGLVVPLLVMVLAFGIIGYSFAWFSDSTTAEIATINLSTAKIFTLTFTTEGRTDSSIYQGEASVLGSSRNQNSQFPIGADGGHLVTAAWADEMGVTEAASPVVRGQYKLDAPFIFGTNIVLDTEEELIDLNVSISNLEIDFKKEDPDHAGTFISDSSRASDRITLPNTTLGYDADAIRYGFTWYMVPVGENKIIGPYGTPYDTVGGVAGNTLNVSASWTSPIATQKWQLSPSAQDIKSFTATAPQTPNTPNYVFYIVFAPEKLFWLQYSDFDYDGNGTVHKPDWQKTVKNVYNGGGELTSAGAYTDEEWSSAEWAYVRKYTSQTYQGATFSFTVTMERTDEIE